MEHTKSLRLSGKTGDSFVIYKDDDENNPLVLKVRSVLPDGEVQFAFCGNDYQIWRSAVYSKGNMRSCK